MFLAESDAVVSARKLLKEIEDEILLARQALEKLRIIVEEVSISRHKNVLVDALAHALQCGCSKDANTVIDAKNLIKELEEDEARILEAEKALSIVAKQCRESRKKQPLQDELRKALDLGVSPTSDTVLRAKELLEEIENEELKRNQALQRLAQVTCEVRESRNKTRLITELKAALSIGCNEDEIAVVEARKLIKELEDAERLTAIAIQNLARVTSEVRVSRDRNALMSEIQNAKSAGVTKEAKVMISATALLEEIDNDIIRKQQAAQRLSVVVGEVRESRHKERLVDEISVAEKAGVTESDDCMVDAKKLLAELEEDEERVRKAEERLAKATSTARDSRKKEYLVSEIGIASKDGVTDSSAVMVDARKLLEEIEEELLKKQEARNRLRVVVTEVRESRHKERLIEEIEVALQAGVVEEDSEMVDARGLLRELEEDEDRIRRAKEKLVKVTNEVRTSRDKDALIGEMKSAVSAGVGKDTVEYKNAETLLEQIEEELLQKRGAAERLAIVVGEVRESRHKERLVDEISVAEKAGVTESDDCMVDAKKLLAELEEDEERVRKAEERLAKATSTARDSRKKEYLVSEIGIASKDGVTDSSAVMVDARKLLEEIEEELLKKQEARNRLRVVVTEVRESKHKERLIEEIEVALQAGVVEEDSEMVDARGLLRELEDDEDRIRRAKEKLVKVTNEVRTSRDKDALIGEMKSAVSAGVGKDTVEYKNAETLLEQIEEEIARINAAIARLRSQLSKELTYWDIEHVESEIKLAVDSGVSESHEVVIDAESTLDTLRQALSKACDASICIQCFYRVVRARRELERLKLERDNEINDLFGDLGNALGM